MTALNRADGSDGLVERLVPVRLSKTGLVANKRREQAVGMIILQVALHAFGTKLA